MISNNPHGLVISGVRGAQVQAQHKVFHLPGDKIHLVFEDGKYFHVENSRVVHSSTIGQIRSLLKRKVAVVRFETDRFDDGLRLGLTEFAPLEEQLELSSLGDDAAQNSTTQDAETADDVPLEKDVAVQPQTAKKSRKPRK